MIICETNEDTCAFATKNKGLIECVYSEIFTNKICAQQKIHFEEELEKEPEIELEKDEEYITIENNLDYMEL